MSKSVRSSIIESKPTQVVKLNDQIGNSGCPDSPFNTRKDITN